MKNHANIAAAQSTATPFAVDRFRCRNNPSGIKGELTLDSIPRKSPNSPAAAARRPSVSPEPQPFWLPLTIAYTASISAAVTVTAPATSRRTDSARVCAVGRSLSDSRTTARPIGTLTRKIQCQSSESVRTPPSTTPIEPPPEATKPKTPIALARSAGSVNRVIISDNDTAEAIAPPTPWTARAPMSSACELARPHASEASVKSVMPIRNIRRWP